MKKCFVGIGLGMKILGNCGGFGRFGNCFYGMVVLVVLMQFATTSGPNKYETCPHNNFICNKVVSDMAEKPTKCTGLVVCYESMLTNHALDGVKYKVNTLYKIHQGKAPRICQKCVDDGKCKESSRGIKHQWNGFMVFYNMDSKAVEVVMDIAGNQAFFNLTDVRPWYFVDAFSSGGKYIDRIRDISNSDIFWENFRKEGIRLEEVLGFEVLELDLGMWNEHYALMDNREERNVHMWMETLENCEESQCPHYTKPSTYDIFGCFCGHPESNKTNENELNNFLNNTNMCCEKYYECLVKLQRNCSGLRTDKMFISIQTDKYDHYTSGMYSIHCEGDKNDFCKQGLCTCDSAVIECWTKVEPFEVSKGCTSCYLDDANDHFYGPIEQVINAREQFLPLELEVMDAAISIVAGTNTSSANQTIIRAVFEVNNAINTTKTAEKNMTSLVISTKDLIDYTYIKYKETMTTDIVAAKAYLTTLEYKKIILSFGIQLFFTEQLETIQASKNILDTVKMLEFSLFNSTEKNIKKKKT